MSGRDLISKKTRHEFDEFLVCWRLFVNGKGVSA
jgi:hypothetical protein